MAETKPVLASAVVIPEAPSPVSPTAAKRRQSFASETDSKRPRLSVHDEDDATRRSNVSKPVEEEENRADRRRSRQDEERKRGQRLFGALLGTLSQSSASATQKKRADIEKRQHAKLKQQAEEDDLKQKEKLEELTRVRQREQKKFDEQSMRIRHSNELAMAHFLQTTAEPKLFFKPYELLPEQEQRIKRQVEEAEATIDRETESFKRKQAEEQPNEEKLQDNQNGHKIEDAKEASTTVGSETHEIQLEPLTSDPNANSERPHSDFNLSSANGGEAASHAKEEEKETVKDIADDGGEGELEQGEEDTVLF